MSLFLDTPTVNQFCQKANLGPTVDELQHSDLMQICSWVQGSSLALEWVAQHSNALGTRLTRQVLAAALCTSAEALPSSHDIEQAAFGCALACLPVPLQQFLRTLSVFEEGWSLDAAEKVCHAPLAQAWCEELLLRQLILCDTTRPEGGYRLRDWVRTRLQAEMEERAVVRLQQAHLAYFFSLARQSEPHLRFTPDALWVRRLEAEKANLLAAFAVSREAQCLQFGLALWRWGYAGAHIRETSRLLHIARFACKTFPEEARPEMYRALGSVFYRKNDYNIAIGYLEEAHRIACQQENRVEAAFSGQMLAILHDRNGQLKKAEDWAQTSLRLWQQIGSLWGQASVLNEKGNIARKRGDFAQARQFFLQSANLWRQLNDKAQEALVFNNLGGLAATQHEYRCAERAYRQSLRCAAEGPDQRRVCQTHNNLAVICGKLRKYRQAVAHFRKSLVLMDKIGFMEAVPCALAGLAEAAHRQGRNNVAVLCLGLAEHRCPHYMDSFSPAEKQELEQSIVAIRRALRPQTYEYLCIKGRGVTLAALLAKLSP